MLVTEGKSDAAIIRKAMNLLKPHIEDFLQFVDMEGEYPFTGKRVHELLQGLRKLDSQNDLLIIYDNDKEGTELYGKAAKLRLSPNVRVMTLPIMTAFRNFLTIDAIGKQEQTADINGQAVSIECFLDLHWQTERIPRVKWSNSCWNGKCQGALDCKEEYGKRYKRLKPSELEAYNTSKLKVLLNRILDECKAIAAARRYEERLASLQEAWYGVLQPPYQNY
jgi:hypothetical protein